MDKASHNHSQSFFKPFKIPFTKPPTPISRSKGHSLHIAKEAFVSKDSSFFSQIALAKGFETNGFQRTSFSLKKSRLAGLWVSLKKKVPFDNVLGHLESLLKGLNYRFEEKTVLFQKDSVLYEDFLDFQLYLFNFLKEFPLLGSTSKSAFPLQKTIIDLNDLNRFKDKKAFSSLEETFETKDKSLLKTLHPFENPLLSLNTDKKAFYHLEGKEESPKKKSNKKTLSRLEETELLQLENAKLNKAIKELSSLIERKDKEGFDSIVIKNEPSKTSNQEILKEKVEDYEKALYSKQQMIIGYKSVINKLEKDLTEIKVSLELYYQENLSLKSNILAISIEKQRYFETALLSMEEINVYKQRNTEISIFSRKLKEKLEAANTKINKLTGSRIENPDNPCEITFEADLSLFSLLGLRLGEKGFKKQRNSPFLTLIKEDEIKRNKEKLSRLLLRKVESLKEPLENDPISSLGLTKPSFFSLIEHKFLAYSNEIHSEKTLRVNPLFLATMRGILDSYYKEYLALRPWNSMGKLVDYMYEWLGLFQIKDKEIIKLSKQEQTVSDDLRIGFLIDFSNGKLNKLWEFFTFKAFMSEEFATDELFFYLHCRNMLKSRNSNTSFELIQYIAYSKCLEVIDLVFCSFEEPALKFLREQLKSKSSKMTLNGLLVDSGFALRLFLEFFRAEKLRKIQLLKDLFLSCHTFEIANTNQLSIAFQSFKRIIESFGFIDSQTISNLYRKTWNLGQGAVNFESFLPVAEEENWFLRTLKVPFTLNFPMKLDFQRKLDPKDPSSCWGAFLYSSFEGFFDEWFFLEKECELLGLPIVSELVSLRLIILNQFQVLSEDLKVLNLTTFFLNCQETVLKAFKGILMEEEEGFRALVIEEGVKWMGRVLKGVREGILKRRKGRESERTKAAKKLQGFFKKKIGKWYILLNTLLGPKGRKGGKKK